VLIASIQEQQKTIRGQQKIMQEQQNTIQDQQKAMQEQQRAISNIKADNEDLRLNLNNIKQMPSSQQQTSLAKTIVLSTAHLEQNVPNPFNQSTSIKYSLPQNVSNALIKIANANGQVLKTFAVTSGERQISLQRAQLTAGTYHYSLIVDQN